jgi:hypothetical protein
LKALLLRAEGVAQAVLARTHPDLHDRTRLVTPDEKQKRHGRAIAATRLPDLKSHETVPS